METTPYSQDPNELYFVKIIELETLFTKERNLLMKKVGMQFEEVAYL